jgi:hypothetical protein
MLDFIKSPWIYFSLLFFNYNSGQSFCKIKTVNHKNAYFYDVELDMADCEEDKQDYYYLWFGGVKDNLLDGKGMLMTYDAKTKKDILSEAVTFSNGYRIGWSKSEKKQQNTHIVRYDLFSKGNLIKSNRIYSCDYFWVEVDLNYQTKEFSYCFTSTDSQNKTSLIYKGILADNFKTFTGTCFINSKLSSKGTFRPEFASELDTSFPLDYYSYCGLVSGVKYLENGIQISGSFLNNEPFGCATIHYPNADTIYSCNFNGSIFLNAEGTYQWSDGRKFVGKIIDSKITTQGFFYDQKGQKAYGSFPKVNTSENSLLGLATIGLVAYGIYKLVHSESAPPVDQNKSTNALPTQNNYTASSNYTGSYSAYSNTTSPHKKCSQCNGRGICKDCNARGTAICWKCEGKGVFGPSTNIIGQELDNTCTSCDGLGFTKCYTCHSEGSCNACKGSGED